MSQSADSPTDFPADFPTNISQDVYEIGTVEADKSLTSAEDVYLTYDEELLKQLEAIPQKMAFKIGEVAEIVGVKQYVLRYWETEFEVLRPKKSNHNQRMYSRKDVESVLLIKKLLYKDRFSISGARAAIKKLKQKVQQGSAPRESFKKYNTALEKARVLLADIQKLQEAIA